MLAAPQSSAGLRAGPGRGRHVVVAAAAGRPGRQQAKRKAVQLDNESKSVPKYARDVVRPAVNGIGAADAALPQVLPAAAAVVVEAAAGAAPSPGLLGRVMPWLQTSDPSDEPAAAPARAAAPAQQQAPRAGARPPVLALAGGGLFYWWEMGVLQYLQENFDLSGVQLRGVSAGALAAVLLACGVSAGRALAVANRLCEENGVWERPGGLAGIWGSIVRQWLDELLPEDAAERCAGRVGLVVTQTPSLRLRLLQGFESRQDLIDACMASVHIPFFLDGNATAEYRGARCVDGSLWDFIQNKNSGMLTCDGEACVVDYFMDDQLQFSRLDFIKLSNYEGIRGLMSAGYAYAQRTDAAGGFEPTLGPQRKWLITRVVEFPVRQLSRALSLS